MNPLGLFLLQEKNNFRFFFSATLILINRMFFLQSMEPWRGTRLYKKSGKFFNLRAKRLKIHKFSSNGDSKSESLRFKIL